MSTTVAFITRFALEIFCLLFMARFWLQACRADFYNPISQFIDRITAPVVRTLGLIIPPYKNLNLAAFAAAWASAGLMHLLPGLADAGAIQLISGSLLHVLMRFLSLFSWAIIIVIIASFLAPARVHPALALLQQVTEPLLAPARRLIPPLGGLDFSPILVILAIGVLRQLLPQLFRGLFGLP